MGLVSDYWAVDTYLTTEERPRIRSVASLLPVLTAFFLRIRVSTVETKTDMG